MNSFSNNISSIVSSYLCNSCGACFSICPKEAVSFKETISGFLFPIVDKLLCNNCGLCVLVCPGISFGKILLDKITCDPFKGKVIESYIGKAANIEILKNGQSGGIASAILIHALDKKLISGAIIVSMKPGCPPRPKILIARTQKEILSAQKSKYVPVPLLSSLKDLLDYDGQFAVVGVSCQIHGLFNVIEKSPKIRDKIAFTIGLICDRIMTYSAIDFIIEDSNLKIEDRFQFIFRDKSISGYPGDVHIISDKSKSFLLPSSNRTKIKNYFTPPRCMICFDKMNIFSDITVGDPHGLKHVDRSLGETILIVRTEYGHRIVQSAAQENSIIIREEKYSNILNGQNIDKKKIDWRAYVDSWKKIGYHLPNYYKPVKLYSISSRRLWSYYRDIKNSIKLVNCDSKENLFYAVKRKLRKKSIINKLLLPARFIKNILR